MVHAGKLVKILCISHSNMKQSKLISQSLKKLLFFFELSIAAFIVLACNIFAWLPLEDTYYLCLLCLLSVLLRKVGWESIGLLQTGNWGKIFLIAALSAIFLQLLSTYVSVPLIKLVTHHSPNLSSFKPLVGNPKILVYYLTLIWTQAAFGEEIAFRGYLMGRIADIFKRSKEGWLISLLVVSITFGFAHFYQGTGGVIDAAISGLFFGSLYVYFNKNLWITILTHGISDTIACFLFYYGIVAI